MASDESQEHKKRSLKRHRKKDSSFFYADGHCLFINSELEPIFPKYKGRVVLRCDIVKDDSDSYAAFTKQGRSASQMTTAKVIGVIVRPHTADAVSACTQVRVSRHLDTSTTTQKCQKYGPTSNQWFFLSEICMATPLPHCWHNSKKVLLDKDGSKCLFCAS